MKESSIKNRAMDEESGEGLVDKSVVNWLMHVIPESRRLSWASMKARKRRRQPSRT